MQKHQTRPVSFTLYKNELKMDSRLEYKNGNHKIPKRKDSNLTDISLRNVFVTPKAKETKAKINKWDYIKKASVQQRKPWSKPKGNTLNVKISANHVSDKGLTFKTYEELIQLNKKANTPIITGTEDLKSHFYKDISTTDT